MATFRQSLEKMKTIDFLQKKFPDSSKRTIKIWMKQGRIEVNGKVLRKNEIQVSKNQEIKLLKREQKTKGLKICFEDKDLIVIEKPAGVLSVNTLKEKNSVFARLKKAYPKTKVYVIHRLDRDTKGLLVFAFNEKTFLALKKQFATKTAKRHYLALLNGSFSKKQGKWIHYLIEDKNTFVKVTHDKENGQRAESHYHILFEKNETSLAHIQLKTGRKNQIRVQAAYQNHPIVGDQKYGNPEQKKRLALHAFYLQFIHPVSKKQMHFYSKPTPQFYYFFPHLHSFLEPFKPTFEK